MLTYNELISKSKELAKQSEELKIQALNIVKQCKHIWNTPVYYPIYKKGYRIHGDPEGTMGVDQQLPLDVPPETIQQWQRTCAICGYTETTQKYKLVETVSPHFE